MVRLKQSFPKAASVQLLLTGPKSLLQGPVLIDAVTSDRWVDVLQEQLGIQVEPGDGVFVCSARYCPTNPKEGDGWRAEISEPISEFISKFERQRKQYSVRLVNPVDVGVSPRREQVATPPRNEIPQISGRPNIIIATQGAGVSVNGSGTAVLQTAGGGQKRPRTEMEGAGPSKQKRVEVGIKVEPENTLEEEEVVEVDGGDNDTEEEDTMSLSTEATQEEAELRIEGIRMESVKQLAQRGVARFSNGFMLRVQHEVHKLQRNHQWDRNVKRAPLCSYLLQELFKGPEAP